MSLIDELKKEPRGRARLVDYLRWVVLVVLVAIALVAAVIMVILAVAGEGAADTVEGLLHHVYIHYGLIPVIVLLLFVAVGAVAFVLQLVMTGIVYWKAYARKKGEKEDGSADRPGFLAVGLKRTGWAKGYYQGIVLLVTNALLAVLLVAGAVYAFGYIGIDVAEQPEFCLMCHEVMKPSYDSYAASTHKGIHCGACHNDPGIEGFVKGEVIAPMKEGWLQVAQEYHLDKHGHLLPSAVPVNNQSCLAGECHKEDRLRKETFRFGAYQFKHGKHLDLEHGGSALTCDSCHAYDKEVHMKVDKRVCGLCHFSPLSEKGAAAVVGCQACHAERPRLTGDVELLHREVADFAKQACNDCHEVIKSKLNLQADACGVKCHHRHGKEHMSAKGRDIHKIHKDAPCMHCHAKPEHKIGSAKFQSAPREVFGKKFIHENHGGKCSDCHGEKEGHFTLSLKEYASCTACHHKTVNSVEKCDTCHKSRKIKAFGKTFAHKSHGDDCARCHSRKEGHLALSLKGYADCTACHHEGVEDNEYCDTCHEAKKIEPFGKRFAHKSHGKDCTRCHGEKAGDFKLTLKGRADCNSCHHEDIDDPDMCCGCHDKQQEFFQGAQKFGMEESPSSKSASEMGCDTCHGDVQKYEPAQCRESCTNCHDEDEDDYNYAKLAAKGKKMLEEITVRLKFVNAKLKAAVIIGGKAGQVAKARKTIADAQKMLDFLSQDGSFGIHNPALFGEYRKKVTDLLKAAEDLLK